MSDTTPESEQRGAAPEPARASRAAAAVRRSAAWLLVLALTLIPRLAERPAFREDNLPPDAAHFLNVARCFERGQGFSNPSAWPAWMKPASLPMPETFKEPGYPFLIAGAARAGADPFRAGQAISFAAGLLLPFVIALLARQLTDDPLVPWLAALIAAGSPLLVDKSNSVLVESLFALIIELTFLAGAWRLRDPERARRSLALDVLTGALFGAAYLLRAQSVLALPSLLLLLPRGRPWRRALPALMLATAAALAVMSPFLARNLRLFGVPFYSDVTAYGLWPYVDHVTFSHGLDRPGSPIAFALSHPGPVAAHVIWSLRHFLLAALPRELYGDPLWMLAFAVGLVALWPRRRDWGFAALYAALTVGLILAVHWDTYYFTSSMTAWCLIAAAGAVWAARAIDARWREAAGNRVGRAPRSNAVLVVVALAILGPLVVAIRRPAQLERQIPTELEAARHEAPFLRAHLAPGEAAMVNVTSYWAWFTDRPAVHVVVADSARFMDTVRRLKVRWAALPTAELPALIAHYPDHRLPGALEPDHADAARGIVVYRVVDPESTAAGRRGIR